MQNILFLLEKILSFLDVICKWLCATLLAAMAIIISAQVVLRWFAIPLSWSVELSQILFVDVTFLGCYLGSRKGKQIIVDMFQNMMPNKLGNFFYRISAAITCVYFYIIIYYCVQLWPKLMASRTPIIHLKTGYIYLGVIAGCIMISLSCLIDIVRGKPGKEVD
jgi:TRAP-type C4-dicarboxylate transport system permease small subunit